MVREKVEWPIVVPRGSKELAGAIDKSLHVRRHGGRLVTQACEFIRLHAGEKIDVDSVAKAQKVSRRTLEMRFREIMNEGVGEVIRHHRLERVCQLLLETRQTIKDIAYKSGFSSPIYLMALFKKTYGKTMSEWRSSK